MKCKKSFMLLIVFCIFMFFIIAAHGKESTTISCYAGNPDDNQYIGAVEVFNVANAAATCNNVFADCNGNCTGCYADKEGQQVCIDTGGNQYTR